MSEQRRKVSGSLKGEVGGVQLLTLGSGEGGNAAGKEKKTA